ncbi:MAG: hypothetical protein PHT84_01365 [Candidatus Pacebacteria bacterium]|nr:hypothetical protein [Candidatus Paceibacterota bacterium]
MDDLELENEKEEPTCPSCGLRVYNEICPNCNISVVNKKDKEEDDDEDYDWRERR